MGRRGDAAAPGHVVEAEDVGRDEQELDGPVAHEDSPPEVEGEVSVVSQEVGVGQGAVLHQGGQASGGQHHLGRGGGAWPPAGSSPWLGGSSGRPGTG